MSPADRRRLEALVGDRNVAQKHVWRARIVLHSADGIGTNGIMRRTGKSKTCVWRWQERFAQEGYDGLLRDKTRPSRIPPLGPEVAERVVALTLSDPPAEATHWVAAMMAKATGISVSSVQRIWRAHGLRPHRVRQFKLSNDPDFVAKLRDVVGLYVDPPAHAIVLSVDEKSQIQALDRTQPGLPMKKGRLGTMTHDDKRHGTTTLFAALNVLEGKVIGPCMQRHRHQEFIRFLNAIEADIPAGKGVHVILDNYAAHKHAKVRAWLGRHERFTFHFVPTSCSWLNAVEGFFAKLSKRRLKRGVFRSIVDLQVAINRFLDETNDNPKPFTWTADPDKIIAAVKRGHQVLDSIHWHDGMVGMAPDGQAFLISEARLLNIKDIPHPRRGVGHHESQRVTHGDAQHRDDEPHPERAQPNCVESPQALRKLDHRTVLIDREIESRKQVDERIRFRSPLDGGPVNPFVPALVDRDQRLLRGLDGFHLFKLAACLPEQRLEPGLGAVEPFRGNEERLCRPRFFQIGGKRGEYGFGRKIDAIPMGDRFGGPVQHRGHFPIVDALEQDRADWHDEVDEEVKEKGRHQGDRNRLLPPFVAPELLLKQGRVDDARRRSNRCHVAHRVVARAAGIMRRREPGSPRSRTTPWRWRRPAAVLGAGCW